MKNEDDNRNKTCWIQFFISPVCLLVPLNAEVLTVVVVVGCVQGSWSQVSTFSCNSHCLPLTQNASKGYQNNFQEPALWYRLSMFCQNSVTCPSIRTDPGIPPPGYSATPRTRVWGLGIRTHTGTGDIVWQPISNLYDQMFTVIYPLAIRLWISVLYAIKVYNNMHVKLHVAFVIQLIIWNVCQFGQMNWIILSVTGLNGSVKCICLTCYPSIT